MSMHALNVGAAQAPFEQSPYRPARVGSGVLCSAQVADGHDRCESPLTTRLRGGRDTEQRPIAEYLCETCGATFVAVTVSVDPVVRFDEVAVPDDDLRERAPIPVATALRRGERIVKKAGPAPKQPTPWTCPEDGAVGLGADDLQYHNRAYHNSTDYQPVGRP